MCSRHFELQNFGMVVLVEWSIEFPISSQLWR
jgi:hypothetical protein